MTIPRIIDANANRAREALRVMEDAARFALDDPGLSAALKGLRHDLRRALEPLPPGWLEANRDVAGDVGTRLATETEGRRTGHPDVVAAAGKRLSEALRSIEEAAKVVDGSVATAVEAMRYRAYAVEARLNTRLATGRARQWRVCVLLTEALCRRSWPDVVREAVAAGADCIQVREKAMAADALAVRTRAVIELARPAGASVIVNDRADVALVTGADGVHLGRDDLAIADTRRLAGRAILVGASTHDLEESRAAVEAGADSCGVGAMFASPTRPDIKPSGPAFMRAFVDRHPAMPHLAIGGITTANIDEVVAAGARGVAVSACVCGAADPGAAVRSLVECIAAEPDPVPA